MCGILNLTDYFVVLSGQGSPPYSAAAAPAKTSNMSSTMLRMNGNSGAPRGFPWGAGAGWGAGLGSSQGSLPVHLIRCNLMQFANPPKKSLISLSCLPGSYAASH